MKIIKLFPLFFVLLFLACNTTKNTSKKSPPKFPEDWLGTYQGNLDIFDFKAGKTMSLPMTIIVSKTDTVNRWRWYSKAIFNGKDIIKDYAVVRHDSMPPNQYIMDENNGIYLDRTLIDDAFYDYFEVNNLGLYGVTRLVGKDMFFEITFFPLTSEKHSIFPMSETDMDTVASFRVIGTQKAFLKRIK